MDGFFNLGSNLSDTGDWFAFLLTVTWKGSLILLIAYITVRILAQASATLRHLVWSVAIAATLVLPTVSLMVPSWDVTVPPLEVVSEKAGENDLPWSFSVYEEEPKAEGDPINHQANATPLNSKQSDIKPAIPSEQIATESAHNSQPSTLFGQINWPSVALIFWLLGVTFIFSRQLLGKLLVVAMAKNAEPVTDRTLIKIANKLQNRVEIGRPVKLLMSPSSAMPMTWGLFRPKILLPAEAVDWPVRRQHLVLLHEMAHIKRGDCFTQTLTQLATALYWFNPLIWIANRHHLKEREHACDDYVLSNAANRAADYADLLLDIARSMRNRRFASFATVAMARPSQLEGRMIAILDPRLRRRVLTRFAILVSAAGVLFLVLPLAAMKLSLASETETKKAELAQGHLPDDESRITPSEAETEKRTKLRTERRSQRRTDSAQNNNVYYNINSNTNKNSNSNSNSQSNTNININRNTQTSESMETRVSPEEWPETSVTAAARATPGKPTQSRPDEFVVKALIEALNDPSLAVRIEAAETLGDMKSRTAVPALINALNDGSWEMRISVIEALGDIGDPAAIEALSKTVHDEHWQVRQESIEALSDLEDRRSIPALISALQDREWQVRVEAAHALGDLEAVSAVSALEKALHDENREVRKMAIEALGEIGSNTSAKALTKALKDTDWEIRKHAAYALGEIENRSATAALIAVTSDPHPEVRKMAAWAFGEIEDPEAAAALSRLLTDESWEVRKQAARALGEIESPSSVTALTKALKDPQPEVRKMAVWALGEIDDARAAQDLIPLLKDTDWEIRKRTAWALGEMEAPAAIPALSNALKDENHEVREMAIWALGEMKDTTAVPALIAAMKDGDWGIRTQAACALGEIGDPRATEALTDALKDEHPEVRESAAKALGELRWRD